MAWYLTALVAWASIWACDAYIPRVCVTLTSSRLPEPTFRDLVLTGYVYTRLEVAGAYWCARRCLQQLKCASFNYHTGVSACQLNTRSVLDDPDAVEDAPGVLYYERETIPQYFLGACEGHNCHPEAVCQPIDATNYTCECQDPNYTGKNCSNIVLESPCVGQPCGSGGTCVETAEGFECDCPPGFTGDSCDSVLCTSYNNFTSSPKVLTSEVEVTWRNEVGGSVDVYVVPHEGTERYAFSIPAAGESHWPANVDYLWVARDQETHSLLMVDSDCSFVVPDTLDHNPTITGN